MIKSVIKRVLMAINKSYRSTSQSSIKFPTNVLKSAMCSINDATEEAPVTQ